MYSWKQRHYFETGFELANIANLASFNSVIFFYSQACLSTLANNHVLPGLCQTAAPDHIIHSVWKRLIHGAAEQKTKAPELAGTGRPIYGLYC